MITGCEINESIILQWERSKPSQKIFIRAYSPEEYESKFWSEINYYWKRFPKLGISHRNGFSKESISVSSEEKTLRNGNLARIYFQSLLSQLYTQLTSTTTTETEMLHILQTLNTSKEINWEKFDIWYLLHSEDQYSHEDIDRLVSRILSKIIEGLSTQELENISFNSKKLNTKFSEIVNENLKKEIIFESKQRIDSSMARLTKKYPLDYTINPLHPHYAVSFLDELYQDITKIENTYSDQAQTAWIKLYRVISKHLRTTYNNRLTWMLSETHLFETLNLKKKYKAKGVDKSKVNWDLMQYLDDWETLLTPWNYIELKYTDQSEDLAYRVFDELAWAY